MMRLQNGPYQIALDIAAFPCIETRLQSVSIDALDDSFTRELLSSWHIAVRAIPSNISQMFKSILKSLQNALTAVYDALIWAAVMAAIAYAAQRWFHWSVASAWNRHVAGSAKSPVWLQRNWVGISVWWSLPALLAFLGYITPRVAAMRDQVSKICMKMGPLEWSRNAFCRGWIISGTTGSGKTECGINILLHGLFQNEPGTELDTWETSLSKIQMNAELAAFQKFVKEKNGVITKMTDEAVGEINRDTGERTGVCKGKAAMETLARSCKDEWMAAEHDLHKATESGDPARLRELESLLPALEAKHRAAEEKFKEHVRKIDELNFEIIKKRRDLNEWMDKRRDIRYKMFPWGGLCLDQKGMFWQVLEKMASHYGRDADLCLLQTRPGWASDLWQPPARLNLLSCKEVPANTYATAIVKTATAMAGGEGDKGFFKVQSEKNIGAMISLCNAVEAQQAKMGIAPKERLYPALNRIHDMLTSQDEYKRVMEDHGVLAPKKKAGTRTPGTPAEEPRVTSREIERWKTHFEDRFWSQPPEQLGGVQGTISNYLAYFCTDDIAEVFCTYNTFELADVDKGKLICLSMPQKYALERRYVATLIKILILQQAQRRFDLRDEELKRCNLVALFQDEAQRFVIDEDKDVDTLRQAVVTSILATQDIPSLFPPLGGKDKAVPILLNLRNRMIGKAADEEGAETSAKFIGQSKKARLASFQKTFLGLFRKNKSFDEKYDYKVHPNDLRAMPDFTFYVCHSEGEMRKLIIQPRDPQDRQPKWWKSAVKRTRHWPLVSWVVLTGHAPKFWSAKLPKDARRV